MKKMNNYEAPKAEVINVEMTRTIMEDFINESGSL